MRARLGWVCCLLWAPAAWSVTPYSGGAVAAAHPLASEAGRQMLDAGGNAVDAAVAAAFTMAVVGPYHSGLGGGGFAVVHFGGADQAFDFREVAPAKASRDMYLRDGAFVSTLATDGALAVAVPGAVKGYLALHAKYGKLPRAQVLGPAIRVASRGFLVTPKYESLAKKREACLRGDPEAARLFLRPGPDGQPTAPRVGTLLKQPELARTLTAIAKQGDAAFYRGPVAKALVDSVQRGGGVLSADDLSSYGVRWRDPLVTQYRGHRVVTMPPPSAGGLILAQVLGMLELAGPHGPAAHEVATWHTFIEALRLAFVDRARFLGDPAFTPVPVERLTSTEYLKAQLARIDPHQAGSSEALRPKELLAPGRGDAGPGMKHTTHLSVVDRQGNAVALTTTLNYYFGACLVARGTGVLLNDQMDDFAGQVGVPNTFSLVQGEANAIAPGKVPLSSMTPTLVFMKDRPTEVLLAVGAPGGSTIPTTVLQVVSDVVDGSYNVAQAVSAGRIHHQWLPDEVWVDSTALDPATAAGLQALGHKLVPKTAWGDVEAVLVDPVTGLRTAASDPRNEGAPAGQF